MIIFAILILIVAKALPVLNTHISSIHVTRITSIVFLFSGALTLNILNLESIGSGIGIYSGLFQVTTITQLIEIFLFFIGGGILIAWPQKKQYISLPTVTLAASEETPSPLLTPKESRLGRGGEVLSYSDLDTNKGVMQNASAIEGIPSHATESRLRSLESLGENLKKSYSLNKTAKYSPSPFYLGEETPLSLSGASVLGAIASAEVDMDTRVPSLAPANAGGTDYSLVVLFSSLGSSLLISSYDLISVYLSIELQSFGLYVLSTLYRDSESSTSAGLKYFLLGGLSSCIILLGTGIIYSYTGTTNLESLYIINSVTGVSRLYIIQGISLGLSLIFIGFLFKIAAAPLHNWSPDVYDGTPTIVTIWLTIIPKIAILFILLELQVKLDSFGPLGDGLKTINFNNNILKTLLLISATLSLIIGSLLGLAQIRVKRLLAYSTISHIGFILLALAVNTEQSIDSFIFYIIQYTITNLNIFLVILGLTYCFSSLSSPLADPKVESYQTTVSFYPSSAIPPLKGKGCYADEANKDISFINEFKGLFFSNPLLSISLAVSLFSMAGIPPLIGFFSKQLVLYSALQNGYYFISVLAIIVSVISCSYYLQIIKLLFTLPSEGEPRVDLKGPERLLLPSASPLAKAPHLSPCLWQGANDSAGSLAQEGATAPKGQSNENNLTNTHSYLISTLTFTILLFFIKPSLILNSTQLLSLSLFYI